MADTETKQVFAQAEEQLGTTGFPPAISTRLWSPDVLASFTLVSPDDVLSQLPRHDGTNPSHRAAIANLLFHLRETDAVITRPGDLPAAESLLQDLQAYLSAGRTAFPPKTLPLARWELHAAAVACDLEGVRQIASLWSTVDPEGSHLHLLSRTLFLLLRDFADDTTTPAAAWDGDLAGDDGFVFDLWNTMALFKATHLHEVPAFLQPNRQLATSFVNPKAAESDFGECVDRDADRLLSLLQRFPRICLSHLEAMSSERSKDLPVARAIAGWCEYVIAGLEGEFRRYGNAAERFSSLTHIPAMQTEAFKGLESSVHAAAADAYGAALKYADAERHAREWIRLEPKNVLARERLAQFLYKQERYSEAVQAFADYVTHLDESHGESWSASFLLKLGLESLTNRDLNVAIESAAFGSPFREQGRKLVGWMAPFTEHLVKTAADKWWTGLWILSDDGAHANLGEAAVREAAGAAFGEAINLQIRECIAGPFASGIGDLLPPDDYWRKFLSQSATLGEQINCLRQTTPGNHEMARQLGKWIAGRFPGLPDYLKKKGSTLPTLAGLRGGAAHRVIAATDLRRLYNEAAALLEKIPAPQSDQSGPSVAHLEGPQH